MSKLKFLNLKTGKTYSSDISEDGSSYINWFEDAQSTNLIYSQAFAVVSSCPKIEIKLNSNVFSLIDNEKLEKSIDFSTNKIKIFNFEYIDLEKIKTTKLSLNGVGIQQFSNYVYVFYVIASSQENAECIEDFTINEINSDGSIIENICKVGADFYTTNEELYINASNFGINIPSEIQKAIYPVNVHEEKLDNIIMNRKFKELISNYWDVIANKGSVKSLINSLKWFEWGDLIKLHEIWKHNEGDKIFYNNKELKPILSEQYSNLINGYAKTTYLALYGHLFKETEQLDDELNPVLEKIVTKWSYDELSLKIIMLANFYETYFMPIYLDLIHATIEDVAFSNTIKISPFSIKNKRDYFYDVNQLNINIKDNDEYTLNNIYVGVSPTTPLGRQYTDDIIEYSNMPEPKFIDNIWDVKYVKDPSDEDLKTLYTQNYNGIGVVIDIECSAKLSIDDKLYKARILLPQELDERNKEIITTINTTDEVINNTFKKSTYKFKLLITKLEPEYNINIEFLSLNGLTYSVNRKIKIVDPYNLKLSIYQILPLPEEELKDNLTKYNINYPGTALFEKIWINTNVNYLLNVDDTQLSNMIVVELSKNLFNQNLTKYIYNYYYTVQLETFKEGDFGSPLITEKIQILGISKKFGFHFGDKDPDDHANYFLNANMLKINKMILYPGFYKMVEYDTANPITNEMICIRPEWINGITNQQIEFAKNSNQAISWKFKNISKNSNLIFYKNIQSPFFAGNKTKLEPGYYDITFNYSIGTTGKIHVLNLNSAICISDINND